MEKPLEIAFHNLPSSPEDEALIREGVDKLERRFGHLIGCRVAVELLHHRHRTGNVLDVHIEMSVPGGELVVSREPHRIKEKYAQPDLEACLRSAFKAAERRLTEFKRRLNREVKTHDQLAVGQVSQLYPDEDHGFVMTPAGGQLYFHRNSLMQGEFNKLRVGDRVRFVETIGDTGPIASKIWPTGREPA